MGSMRLRREWWSWLESHEMDVSVDVRFDYVFGFNACLILPLTFLKLKVSLVLFTCSSRLFVELTLGVELTLALRCFHPNLQS
jgi:hypothetical protein